MERADGKRPEWTEVNRFSDESVGWAVRVVYNDDERPTFRFQVVKTFEDKTFTYGQARTFIRDGIVDVKRFGSSGAIDRLLDQAHAFITSEMERLVEEGKVDARPSERRGNGRQGTHGKRDSRAQDRSW